MNQEGEQRGARADHRLPIPLTQKTRGRGAAAHECRPHVLAQRSRGGEGLEAARQDPSLSQDVWV